MLGIFPQRRLARKLGVEKLHLFLDRQPRKAASSCSAWSNASKVWQLHFFSKACLARAREGPAGQLLIPTSEVLVVSHLHFPM